MAVTRLLPEFYGANQDAGTGEMLRGLAGRVLARHQDRWLADVLNTRRSAKAAAAFAALSEAARANVAANAERAGEQAQTAVRLFRGIASEAGVERAQLEYLFSLQWSAKYEACAAQTDELWRAAKLRTYPWIAAGALIESGACREPAGDFERTIADWRAAIAGLETSGYGVMRLRALGFSAGLLRHIGDTAQFWREQARGLALYWDGNYPPVRAQQFYSDVALLARATDLPNTAAAASRENEAIAAALGSDEVRASSLQLRAMAEMAAGFPESAKQHLHDAYRLAAKLPSESRARFALNTEMEMAGVETGVGDRDDRLNRLLRIKPEVQHLSVLRQRMYDSEVGRLLLLKGQYAEAHELLRSALSIGDASRLHISEAERPLWVRTMANTYRALVESDIWLGAKPPQSLALWEQYREELFDPKRPPSGAAVLDRFWGNAPLRSRLGSSGVDFATSTDPGPEGTPSRSGSLGASLSNPPAGQALLTFVELPSGIAAWLRHGDKLLFRRLDRPVQEIRETASRFTRGCASENSPEGALRADGRQLSQWLLGPWDRELDGVHALVIEADDPLSALPWPALVRSKGSYWAGDFSIELRVDPHASAESGALAFEELAQNGAPRAAIDCGVPRLNGGAGNAPLCASMEQALVVGAPAAGSDLGLPPLPEAIREAQKVYAMIPRSVLLKEQSATLPEVRAHLSSARVFHFAGHGYGGEGGGLILRGSSGGWALLRAADIGNLDLSRCLLAVLSGCSTGSGELHGAGDPRSLVRAFLRAGARQVVASEWDLSSPGTSAFMQEFYEAVLHGSPVAESLRRAGAALRRSGGEYAHPYYWAGLEVFE